jgi:hypothetical protein
LGRLVNHCRAFPNLKAKVVMLAETPHIILIAKKDIKEGKIYKIYNTITTYSSK